MASSCREVIQKYLGKERRAGSGTFKQAKKSGGRYEATLAHSVFSQLEEKKYHVTFEKTLDEVVGQVFSTSFANKELLGDKAESFEQELRDRLTVLNPSGVFEKSVEYFAIFAKRS